MSNKPGDKAICQMCNEWIEFVGPAWKHTGLPPGVQPRHPAWPREPVPAPGDLEGDSGVVLPYRDAPEDERIDQADAAHALERITEQIAGILGCCGRNQDLCEMDAQLIRHVWTNALRVTT